MNGLSNDIKFYHIFLLLLNVVLKMSQNTHSTESIQINVTRVDGNCHIIGSQMIVHNHYYSIVHNNTSASPPEVNNSERTLAADGNMITSEGAGTNYCWDFLRMLQEKIQHKALCEMLVLHKIATNSRRPDSASGPMEFFNELFNIGRLHKRDVIYLQCLLWKCNLKEQFYSVSREVNRICDELGITISHLQEPSMHPKNGYKYVHFKVNVDALNIDVNTLRRYRREIAQMLSVPEHFVELVGAMPSESAWLTFLVPESTFEALEEELKKNNPELFGRLADLQIDHISFQQKSPIVRAEEAKMGGGKAERERVGNHQPGTSTSSEVNGSNQREAIEKNTEQTEAYPNGIPAALAAISVFDNLLSLTKINIHSKCPQGFVPIRAFDAVCKCVEEKGMVIVTGLSGDGKTTLGYQVLVEFEKKGYLFLILADISDCKFLPWQRLSETFGIIILIDDILGKSNYDDSKLEWGNWLELMLPYVDKKSVKLVMTSRTHIYSHARKADVREILPSVQEVGLTREDFRLTDDEMKSMLTSILKYAAVPVPDDKSIWQIIDAAKDYSHIGFPQCCQYFATHPGVQTHPGDFFKYPVQCLREKIDLLAELDLTHN